ncbi:MAG: hypothetical protein EXR69_11790 [Myxococcales bacterium]|nr:hypothetical protein [Myxococcales bacterium]
MTAPRPALLAAIDRRLWRDLGFADPEPDILRFLPMIVVAWADGTIAEGEREQISEHAKDLSKPLQAWIEQRLLAPPGPYFRYQVAHLLTFLASVWPADSSEKHGWQQEADQWADEIIAEAGWLKRLFGGLSAERRQLADLRKVLSEGEILSSDRIWALAKGAHASFAPRHTAILQEEREQCLQALSITLEGPADSEAEAPASIAVAALSVTPRDLDLDPVRVTELLTRYSHVRENERWIVLAEEISRSGRPLTPRQRAELSAKLTQQLGHPFEEVPFAELAYLEDALAADAHWVSWLPGKLEELHIDRDWVIRKQVPGTFNAPRSEIIAMVDPKLVPGPRGLGFRVLDIQSRSPESPGRLRLASPVFLQEPPTVEAVDWVARHLPDMCDPCSQLVLDEATGTWMAEVHSHCPDAQSKKPEPLPEGRALLVPPWIWFRAARALNVRFFAGKRNVAA